MWSQTAVAALKATALAHFNAGSGDEHFFKCSSWSFSHNKEEVEMVPADVVELPHRHGSGQSHVFVYFVLVLPLQLF